MKLQMSPKVKEILEWVYCILIAIVLALLVRYYVGTPTIVQQPSMYPTLKPGQRLILNRWARTIKEMPKRGEIITFEAPSSTPSVEEADRENPKAIYNYMPPNFLANFTYHVLEFGKTSYIKRVIALPGEHIQITDEKVFINGEKLEESYLQPGIVTDSMGGPFTDLTVPEGYVFVMGDNRSQSADSRVLGCIPIDKIESKVWIRFWPFDVFGKVE